MSTVTEQGKVKESADEEFDAQHRKLVAAEKSGRILTLLVAFAALTALAAGLVALDLNGGLGHTTTVMQMPPNGVNGHMSGGGAGMNGQMMYGTGRATAGSANRASGTAVVSSTLGEYYIRPNMTSVRAGKIEFTAQNVGQVTHELMVERMPMKMDGPNQPNEDAALGMISDMSPGASGKMTLNLKPGMYALFCNIPGHYAAGQHTPLRVTGG